MVTPAYWLYTCFSCNYRGKGLKLQLFQEWKSGSVQTVKAEMTGVVKKFFPDK